MLPPHYLKKKKEAPNAGNSELFNIFLQNLCQGSDAGVIN